MKCQEGKPDQKEKPLSSGHQFRLRTNTESRKTGLKKLQDLMEKNLGLRPKPVQNGDEREKRGISGHSGHDQNVHHEADCAPDYIVEYHVEYYYPEDYCY